MFVDQQRKPGQRLRQFTILGESEAEGSLRYLVKLALENPEESALAFYHVFGQGPIWVYRAEDFDMIMHMDQSMTGSSTPASRDPGASGTSDLRTRP
jgi:hypothetical protein